MTQENLPAAVPFMLMALIFAEGQNVEQMQQAARWFFEVGKTGFRFRETYKFLEFMRRAIELRRSPASSWSGSDLMRAREDHTLEAQGSKIMLEGEGGLTTSGGKSAVKE